MEFVRELLGLQAPKTLAEVVRERRAELQRCCSDLTLECLQMDREERRLEPRIRERAQKGKMREVKALARQLVQYERSRERLIVVQSRLQEVSTRLATVQSQQQMTAALATAVRAMRRVRMGAPGMPSMQRVLQVLAVEEMKAEALDEAMDEGLGFDDGEEDEDELVSAVLQRLDIEVADELDGVSLPSSGVAVAAGDRRGSSATDRARAARLAALERPAQLEAGGSGDE